MTVTNLPRSAAKQPEPYREHDIILTEGFKFAIVFEDEEHPTYCNSLIEAHANIDEHIKRQAKQRQAKETCKLHYAGLDAVYKLKTGTVKGFHASQGHLLTDDGAMSVSVWYPDTPMIRDYITRLGALRREARDIEAVLAPFKMSPKPVYGRTAAERYDAELARIVKDYEAKKAKARDASLKIEGEPKTVQVAPGLKVSEV